MKFNGYVAVLALIALVAVGFAAADRLPNQTPENQKFEVSTVIDATGMVTDTTEMSWVIATPGSIPTGILGASQVIALADYRDHIMTNGGKMSENRNFKFDSRDKTGALNNIETEKVLTYASTEGAHLEGEEFLQLDVAGNFTTTADSVRCVFMANNPGVIPAFCNKVTAKSTLISVNSAQIATKGKVRAVAATSDVPAALSYSIAVTPDSNSGSGFADGTVKTYLGVGIMEARDNSTDNWNKAAVTNTWTDSTGVTGGIKNFQKGFDYVSGIKL